MAKNAIKAILDDDNSGTIDDNDEKSLKIRVGYMRFYNCFADDTGGSYSSGCNSLITAIPNTDPPPFSSPSKYSDIWSQVNAENANGGTPLASALSEAKLYLDAHKSSDSANTCRQKFVILITDGQDTFACNGNGSDSQSDMYKRRKASVKAAKALKDAGYKVFVVGFGANMPAELQNTLNWMAYYAGTDNPEATKSGNTSAITISTDPCNEGSSNDPGNASLSGYAFLATQASELGDALTRAFDFISSSRISFTASSVAAFRTTSENFLYEASFQPVSGDPFWIGHLRKYSINADGSVGSMERDAGNLLQSIDDPSTRKLYTYVSGAVTPFDSGHFSAPGQEKKYFNVDTGTQALDIISYIRGEAAKNPDDWKLGDIFHSNTITIGSPSAYFTDIHSPQAFIDFRNSHATRERILVVGANDGQFRAFSASDLTEKWSFIPPNQLPRLKFIAHSTEPTTLTHKYFVDGGVSAADVWLGSGDGTAKSPSDWHTLLVFGEGKGVRDSTNNNPDYQWSSSSSCDTDFSRTYSSTYQYYCGYYAFDVTATGATAPVYMWLDGRLNLTNPAEQGPYLGEPWSRMAMGKVIIAGSEKWVGFIGGGYNGTAGDTRGRGFFVVDLSKGDILWSYTKANNASMAYAIPASPAIVDTDNDGFIDTAYVGDLGGNMWRLKFCTQVDGSSCNTGNWSGGLLFEPSERRPIYTTATVARDTNSLWVFWGTGDKENPLSISGQDSFFAVKDRDRTATNLQDVSAVGETYNGTSDGWFISFGSGEKSLSDPTVFGGIVLFTTYTPTPSSTDPCARVGTAKLYALAMMQIAISTGGGYYRFDPGAGVLSTPASPSSTTGGARSVTLGTGLAKEPVVSQKPAPGGATDLYISVSGGIGGSTSIVSSVALGSTPLTDRLQTTAPSSQVLHWKDGRLQ
jgi:Tfp pilus tip-associated adhesin PilY1